MRHSTRFAAALVLVSAVSLAAADEAMGQQEMTTHNAFQLAGMSSDEQEVWRVIEEWNEAFAANDPDRYFEFIDEDVTVMTPSSPYRVEGLPDDRHEFEFGLLRGYSRVAVFQEIAPIVRVFGDFAVATYFNRGYYGPDDGGRMVYLKETNVLRRADDGWRIIHIHVSQ